MNISRMAAALSAACPLWALADHSEAESAPVKSLGVVTVTSGQPTSLPTQIPATMEGISASQVEQTVNATDSEDAIKYFPSLLLRKRYLGNGAAFAPRWKSVLGLRAEHWQARDGFTSIPGAAPAVAHRYAERNEGFLSPKAALSYQWSSSTVFKASAGRAVRMPTVSELYGNVSTSNSQYINDPNLRPERSWTTELTAEQDLGHGLLRLTLFSENVHDSLYSQTTFDATAGKNITRVQNVGRIQTHGWELAYGGNDVWKKGLDINASITYADSRIKENAGFVSVAGDTIGKAQPRVPLWRATAQAAYRFNERWSTSLAVRYSGRQYSTLNNADSNGQAYQGASPYLTADVRLRYRLDKQWSAAFGIDNLNNCHYWNFHPYPQRSYSAELKFDL